MNLRSNINRIHFLLTEKFQNVEINENSSLKFGKYFEISIKENKTLKIILPFRNIDGVNNFNFHYFSNPNDQESYLIERSTNTEQIVSIVEDILNNNRFSEDYIVKKEIN